MSKFRDFICNSEILEPRTITYGKWSIVSTGFGKDRYIYVARDGMTKIGMRININVACWVCEIRAFNKIVPEIYSWLIDTCCIRYGNAWFYDSWEDVDALMWKLVDYIRHAR